MLALTVLQPWASLLVHGVKDIENRTWAAPHALLPGRWLAIHAGRIDREAIRSDRIVSLIRNSWKGAPRDLLAMPHHAILGAVRVEGYGKGGIVRQGYCHCRPVGEDDRICDLRPSCSEWASGPVCWCFDQAVTLEEPMLGFLGHQKLWTLSDLIVGHLQAAIDMATVVRPDAAGRLA